MITLLKHLFISEFKTTNSLIFTKEKFLFYRHKPELKKIQDKVDKGIKWIIISIYIFDVFLCTQYYTFLINFSFRF